MGIIDELEEIKKNIYEEENKKKRETNNDKTPKKIREIILNNDEDIDEPKIWKIICGIPRTKIIIGGGQKNYYSTVKMSTITTKRRVLFAKAISDYTAIDIYLRRL